VICSWREKAAGMNSSALSMSPRLPLFFLYCAPSINITTHHPCTSPAGVQEENNRHGTQNPPHHDVIIYYSCVTWHVKTDSLANSLLTILTPHGHAAFNASA
jgi:hypothetical protein